MRIDGSIGPDHLNLPKDDGKASASKSKPSSSKAVPASDDSVSERISAHQALIQAALSTDEVNTKAVEEARKALESGELDTPEAARRAAESMIDRGI